MFLGLIINFLFFVFKLMSILHCLLHWVFAVSFVAPDFDNTSSSPGTKQQGRLVGWFPFLSSSFSSVGVLTRMGQPRRDDDEFKSPIRCVCSPNTTHRWGRGREGNGQTKTGNSLERRNFHSMGWFSRRTGCSVGGALIFRRVKENQVERGNADG